MSELFHELLISAAERHPDFIALSQKSDHRSYQTLVNEALRLSTGLKKAGLRLGDRVAVFLPKSIDALLATVAVSAAGGIFVPVNPVLRHAQLRHILHDSGASVLVTTPDRAELVASATTNCPTLKQIIWTNPFRTRPEYITWKANNLIWSDLLSTPSETLIDRDPDRYPCAIFYTSGSSGHPKGVVVSHSNVTLGAKSVACYLSNRADDVLLGILPLSFDYGFSQVTTAWASGARCHLMNYSLPLEVLDTVIQEDVTGLAAVPTMWAKLADINWPTSTSLRYITNSGGRLPHGLLTQLRRNLPDTRIYLMYGFTEAFRSTYLPPEEIERRPNSIGKAIPNTKICVLRPDGTECAPGEAGELVHEGPLVSMGYWRQPEATRKLYGGTAPEPPSTRRAWSGDIVKRDQDGFFYYIGRRDQLIKTSGYRVSPNEIEEVIFASNLVASAAVTGLPHDMLGQSIEALVIPKSFDPETLDAILGYLRRELPRYMLPSHVVVTSKIPLTPHGKIDYPAVNSHLNSLLLSSTDIPLSSTDRPPILLTTT